MIRPARPQDAAGVAEVSFRGWTVSYDFIEPALLPEAPDPEAWEERLVHPTMRTLVWDQDGTIVGFASGGPVEPIDREPEGTGILLGLYVDPAAQNAGVGTALMEAMLDDMRAQGLHQAILWTFEANERARRFYERHGWTPEPESTQPHDRVKAPELRYRRPL